ncbi:ABC transporter ATP-binding protein [Micromonospora sp. NPDC005203]|uniref:ABC transporter ATP-binding protein n=1 Tax=Micromonospora sp. NPDC005203 TaxID=3364226 RepID=UPI0036B32D0A
MTGSMAVRTRGLSRWYGWDNALVRAVDEVDLDVPAGQTLAIMGPSGCGKDELTAVENVEMAALLAGWSPGRARRRALHLLDQVGLADRATHLPSALSGGQRQRVAIARALSNEPQVVLADEPTGNLDTAAILEVLRLFEELRTTGQTLVVVTHDARIAAVADRVISMRDGAFADDSHIHPLPGPSSRHSESCSRWP